MREILGEGKCVVSRGEEEQRRERRKKENIWSAEEKKTGENLLEEEKVMCDKRTESVNRAVFCLTKICNGTIWGGMLAE